MKLLILSIIIVSLLVLFGAIVGAATDPDLVLYLDFNEGKGDKVRDCSGKGNDGFVHGNSVKWTQGKYGPAINFNGVDNYVEVQLTPELTFTEESSFSIMAWIKTDAEPTENIGIVTNYKEQTTPFWNICVRQSSPMTGVVRFQFRDKDGNMTRATTPGPMNDGEWHHVAGVRDVDKDTARLYVDGQLIEEVKDTTTGDINSGQNVWIGIIYTNCFEGIIDEVKVWKRPLSADEVKVEMNKESLAVTINGKLAAMWGEIKAGD